MSDTIKSWSIGVATAISVAALSTALDLYTDVQVLKTEQIFQKDMILQQKQSSEQIKDLLTSLDKQMAVQEKTVTTLSDMVIELKTARSQL